MRFDGKNTYQTKKGMINSCIHGSFAHYDYNNDLQGNMLTLTRQGLIAPGVYGQIDDITATFSGNQLLTLRDDAPTVLLEASLDLPEGAWSGSDFAYDANGNQTRDMSRGVSDVTYNVLNLPQRVEFASGARIDYLYSASGTKLAEIVYDTDGALISRRDYVGQFEFVADTLERTLLPEGFITAADSTFHVFIPDYQGNIVGVYNSATNSLEQFTDYYPYGLPHASATAPTVNRRKYGAKELTTDHGLNLYDFAARWHNPAFPHFTTPDPLAEKYYSTSPFAYCAADPINLIDPTGESPVYDMGGNYLGCTSEGFTGMILIYVGTEIIDPAKYSNAELKTFAGADLMTYDEARESNNTEILESAYSRIWTHVVSQFEGMQVYDEVFSMSSISGGEIGYKEKEGANWETSYVKTSTGIIPKIAGTNGYEYESTVENIALSVIVHEWYSHGRKLNHDDYKSHRLAYKNVINFNSLWNKTTDRYKQFNLRMLLKYTVKETGRTQVDRPYRRLYNKSLLSTKKWTGLKIK